MRADLVLYLLYLVIACFGYLNAIGICDFKVSANFKQLIDEELNQNAYPMDLINLRNNVNVPNKQLSLINCSKFLTLKSAIYQELLMFYLDYNLSRFYVTFYVFLVFHYEGFLVQTNENILFLINSFSSTDISADLGRNLYRFYENCKNWHQYALYKRFLHERHFDPRRFLLQLTCSLLQNFDNQNEKWALSFLIVNRYECELTSNLINANARWPVDLPDRGSSRQNINAISLNAKSNIRNNRHGGVLKLPSAKFRPKSIFANDVINDTRKYLFEESEKNVSLQQLPFQIPENVEIDGPCKDPQRLSVKISVRSLLTAIDSNVPSESINLLQKMLKTVHSFPVEEYNARGQLLRDLIPFLAQKMNDEDAKRKLEVILEYVLLDGPGALPLKIKLKCEEKEETIGARMRRNHLVNFQQK